MMTLGDESVMQCLFLFVLLYGYIRKSKVEGLLGSKLLLDIYRQVIHLDYSFMSSFDEGDFLGIY